MRIGFDMLAVQSPHHGHRGIGRYSRHLVSAWLDRDDGHDFYLYAHASLPGDPLFASTRRPCDGWGLVPTPAPLPTA